MSIITSISGIRGTIGGDFTDTLNPINTAEFTTAYALFLKKNSPVGSHKVVVGRDGRMSGEVVQGIVVSTLRAMGFDVVVLGLSSTPTTEIAVVHEKADGGIIITASHNPYNWNALKLLNHRGEFLSAAEGKEILATAEARRFVFAPVDALGALIERDYTTRHVQDILALPVVDADAVRAANLTVVVDCVNSVGATIVPELLSSLGVSRVVLLNGEVTGNFAHNPEPLPENLQDLSHFVVEKEAHVGFAVDPDVDRLAIVCEDGSMFGEEYTLVSIADYLLSLHPGSNTVSNLSSTRALRDVTIARGGSYYPAAVGEVNVVEKMKEVEALIGGEGNGGIIYPAAHYGRDALVGIAIFLTMMARKSLTPKQIRTLLPDYAIVKRRIDLRPDTKVKELFHKVRAHYDEAQIDTTDGVKVDLPHGWVHLRSSNTEPIIRVYAEAATEVEASELAQQVIDLIAS